MHLLRVSLRYVEPDVWQRIAVVPDMPLPKLAKTLEQAMGWEGDHLHMFDAGGVLFGIPDEDADYLINEKAAKVKHVLPAIESALRWDYDFGDGWEHDIVLEAIEPLNPKTKSCFDCGTKARVQAHGNDIGRPAFVRRATAATGLECVDVDVTGNLVGQCFDVIVTQHAAGLVT